MLMLRIAAALVALVVVGLGAGPSRAAESILYFRSETTIRTDGWIDVHETISVMAEGVQIKRGIYRDFPTDYQGSRGQRVQVDFEVLAVRRDGRSEPYRSERLDNGVRIYIGDKNVLIPHGQHSYEIEYRTSRQIGFFPEFDELYWNVTGNGWVFPIAQAVAVIHLPAGAAVVQQAAYTGRMGEQGRAFEVVSSGPGEVVFRTTKPLRAGEGLTIAVAWPKGFVAAPSTRERIARMVSDYAGFLIPAAAVLLALLYYVVVWWRVGRDPPRGVIIPLFEPPADVSPPAARYLTRMAFDDTALAAGIVGLAVKGHLKITDVPDSDVYRLDRLTNGADNLLSIERGLLTRLFPSDRALVLGSDELSEREEESTRERIVEARDSLSDNLAETYRGRSFFGNNVYQAAGVGVCFGLLILAFLLTPDAGSHLPTGFVVAAIAMFVMIVLFKRLLKAPTLAGRQLLDKLEGFKLYLGFAEKDRMAVLHPPDMTPEIYERYLPYALALDVENQWSEQFANVLAKSGQRYETYEPRWYSGRSWRSGRDIDFGRRIAVALPAAILAAATPPGSSDSGGSSGSSGGGSSGGGGGGGGGGGW
jgi:uncharacterized membrane protein YgcG